MDREPAASIRPADLITAWNARADLLHEFGDPNSARIWRIAASELASALASFGAETLTLAEAAQVSGYSRDYIRQQIAAKKIPNAGKKHAPRVRRGDLTPKPTAGRGRPPLSAAQQRETKQVTPISKLKRR